MKRKQFPIIIAFAITINRSQGLTFDRVGIYLPTPVFSHGQLYVAFSRATSQKGIFLQIIHNPQQSQGYLIQNSDTLYTKNIVNREIFNS